MMVEHLAAFGFSPRILECWRAHGVEVLLPLQRHAAARTGLLHGRSIAVFAPTSSGKTFLGEMAAMRHEAAGGRTVFLVPTKALAEELYGRLRRVYSGLGFRVVISTRERGRDDGRISAGEFDLAVMIYEKLRTLLVTAPQIGEALACVVVDEVQILADPDRAVGADLVLTKLMCTARPPQFVCTSAAVDDADQLCQWMGCERLVWRERPVELREGVLDLASGRFAYREWNSGERGVEQLFSPPAWRASRANMSARRLGTRSASREGFGGEFEVEEFWDGVLQALRILAAANNEQVLLFVPTRAMSRGWASRLANELRLPAASSELWTGLGMREPSCLQAELARCLAGGVAFHNADLPPVFRGMVEEAFRWGEVRVLVATSTLAQGVNLTCRNVVSLPVMVRERGLRQVTTEPLSVRQLRNQGGRAGRFKLSQEFGRSIVLAPNEAWAHRLEERLLGAETEPLEPPRLGGALGTVLTDLLHPAATDGVARGACRTVGDVERFIARMFVSHVHRMVDRVDMAVAELKEGGLVRDEGGGVATTGLGEVAAIYGLAPHTVKFFAAFVRGCMAERRVPSEFEVLAAVAFSPDGGSFVLPATRAEVASCKFVRRMMDTQEFELIAPQSVLGEYLRSGNGLSEFVHTALKKSFLALDWVAGLPLQELEQAYGVFGGTVMRLGEHFAWLAHALSAVACKLNGGSELYGRIELLATRLPLGIPLEAQGLVGLAEAQVDRQVIVRLVREGFDSLEALVDAAESAVVAVVGRAALAVQDAARKALAGVAAEPNVADGGSRNWGDDAKGDEDPYGTAEERVGKQGQARAYSLDEVCEEESSATAGYGKQVEPDKDDCAVGVLGDWQGLEGGVDVQVELALDPSSPGLVYFRGKEFFLSVLPYRLLLHMARNPRRVVPYAELDEVLWPDAKVEQQQILAHKAAVVRKFGAVCGGAAGGALLRTIAGHGLYLDLAPEHIRVGGIQWNSLSESRCHVRTPQLENGIRRT